MELEVLDQLLSSDEPLHLAWIVFEVENVPANLERARRAIRIQVQEGLLQVVYKSNSEERILEDWEVKQVLAEEENWLASPTDAKYFLRLTEEGGISVTG